MGVMIQCKKKFGLVVYKTQFKKLPHSSFFFFFSKQNPEIDMMIFNIFKSMTEVHQFDS